MCANIRKAKEKLIKLYKEFKEENEVKGLIAAPEENDIFKWNCIIQGPPDTIWADGYFTLELKFEDDYPTSPPKAIFNPSIYHPNVYKDGRLCLDILTQKHWDRYSTMSSILLSIQSLLNDPNPASPANNEANDAFLAYSKDPTKDEYKRKVRECVEKSWEYVQGNASD